MCEVESIINGRSITKVSEDAKDLEPLTPNHLLLLKSGSVLPPGTFRKEDIFSCRRWHQVQYMADQFWRQWSKEYLPLLQQRQKWHYPHRNIEDDTSPRKLLADGWCGWSSTKQGWTRSPCKVKNKNIIVGQTHWQVHSSPSHWRELNSLRTLSLNFKSSWELRLAFMRTLYYCSFRTCCLQMLFSAYQFLSVRTCYVFYHHFMA